MRLIQIVPHLPPPMEGVGTYALALARELRRRMGVASQMLVTDPAWTGSEPGEGASAVPLAERSARGLMEALHRVASGEGGTPEPVLVHYANYAYQRRGCPRWLVDGLLHWRREVAGGLVTLFHEVYATGPPWRSSFWLWRRQRRLARALAAASTAAVTSLERYAARLAAPASRDRVEVRPVFSTVGEPTSVPPLARRGCRLVTFGGRGGRRLAYGRLRGQLEVACRTLETEEILDVGPPLEALPAAVAGVPVRGLGPLPASEVSRLLADARAGFLAYPGAFLPKSTVFAAYAAHGVIPVCAWPREPTPGEGLQPGEHYWGPAGDKGALTPEELESMAAAAHRWYQDHSLERQVELFGELLSR